MNLQWGFKQWERGDKIRDPIQGEFFSTDAIRNPAEAFVRETDRPGGGEALLRRPKLASPDERVNRGDRSFQRRAFSLEIALLTQRTIGGLAEGLRFARLLLRRDSSSRTMCPYVLERPRGVLGCLP